MTGRSLFRFITYPSGRGGRKGDDIGMKKTINQGLSFLNGKRSKNRMWNFFYLKEMLGRLVKKSRAADVSRNSEANMEFLTNERVTLSKYPPLICILFSPSTSRNSSLPF